MNVDREDLKKHYAAISDKDSELIKGEELVDGARECYEDQALRRSTESQANEFFVGVAGGSAAEPHPSSPWCNARLLNIATCSPAV